MAIGMTVGEYWEGDNSLPAAYRKADQLRQERINEQAWLQGMYIYDALARVAPIYHAFAKAGTRPVPYPDKPYDFKRREQPKTLREKESAAEESARKIGNLSTDIIEYANNHQLPIHLVVESACKFLGTYTDPQQCEAQAIIGKEYLLPPKPFPEAMAYSIVIDDITYYEYLLIRTKERFEDGTAVFTNETQEIPFRIKFQVDPNTRSANFNFTIKGGSNSDHLRYERFLRAAHSKGHLKIHHLESGKNLLEVSCNAAESEKYIDTLNREIAFLENMVTIEHYFDEVINVPEQITLEDVRLIRYVATLLQGKEVRNHWRKYETTMTIASQTKQNMRAEMDKSYSLTYVGTTTVNIFGHSLTYPIMRTFCSVRLENPEKVTKLLGILEEGEDISIVFIPGEETGIGEYVDQLGESGNNT